MPISIQDVHGPSVDPDVLKLTTAQLVEMFRAGGKDRTFAGLELGRRKVNRFDKSKRDKS